MNARRGLRVVLAVVPAVLAHSVPARAQAGAQPVVHGGAPSVSPDGSRIAFLSERGGTTDVFVSAADGTGEVRLTDTPEREGQPEWSADGKELRFSVYAGDSSRLYTVGLDGKGSRLLGAVPGRALRMSPDARSVLYWTGTWTAMKMFSSNLDGSGARPLTDGSGVVWGARWSPDGKRIAFADHDERGNLHVYSIASDGSDRRRVTRLGPEDLREQMPAWSPDGSKLAVQAGAKGEPTHVWIVEVSTGAGHKLAPHDEAYQDETPAWFPDGKRLAFQSDRTGRMEVWVMSADGSDQRQVTR